jgi:hypothetical protein
MVNNCWALLRGLWLILTTDTDPSLPSTSKDKKKSSERQDSKNECIHD